jgi:DnaJ family protein C protein 17
MPNEDLLKWTTSEIDFYALLNLDPNTFSPSELRSAYRKTALKYHPDKVGSAFDPEKYEQFQAANDVLGDAELKAKYDAHRNAREQKKRAADLFEGKRRKMKEDLEMREAGGLGKRRREDGEDDAGAEMQGEIRRLAEEGRKRRAARQSMMPENVKRDPIPEPTTSATPSTQQAPEPKSEDRNIHQDDDQEDEVARLERLIAEAAAAKAKRKAEKKARKSGIYVPSDSPATTPARGNLGKKEEETPKRPDIFRGLKADEKSASASASSPKFSFSPNVKKGGSGVSDFAATMERLKEAERRRLEDEIREREKGEV